jgi:Protein of unknown function (DUF1566)
MLILTKISIRSAALVSIAFALLTACSSSPEPTVVAADFSVNGVKGTANGQNITLDLSGLGNCATAVENMAIGINAYGASISPDPRVDRDYSQAVQFTLTAPDGTKAVYTVTVKGAACLTAAPVTPCSADAIGSAGYSLVFKGCSAANMAEYYDKTECVRDNTTGLIWQGQTPAGTGLRANDQLKTNFDSTTGNQNFNNGTPIPVSQAQIDVESNSIGFKNAVNTINLCGSAAWRLPTQQELLGIVKITSFPTPTLDNDWFPNAVAWFYWTSSPVPGYDASAWYVGFLNGYQYNNGGPRDGTGGGNIGHRVRLVR